MPTGLIGWFAGCGAPTRPMPTRGTDTRTRVATSDSLGSTGAYPLATLPVDQLSLAAPTMSLDTEGVDGSQSDILLSARAAVPEAGTHRLSATLLGPDGAASEVTSNDVDLPAGVQDVTLRFGVEAVHAGGPGRYTVLDLVITTEDPEGAEATAPPAFLVIEPDDAGDPGSTTQSLLQLWQGERADRELTSTGLDTSERNRLERVARAAQSGDVARAVAELDRFIEHVEQQPNGLTAGAAQRVISAATLVRHALREQG